MFLCSPLLGILQENLMLEIIKIGATSLQRGYLSWVKTKEMAFRGQFQRLFGCSLGYRGFDPQPYLSWACYGHTYTFPFLSPTAWECGSNTGAPPKITDRLIMRWVGHSLIVTPQIKSSSRICLVYCAETLKKLVGHRWRALIFGCCFQHDFLAYHPFTFENGWLKQYFSLAKSWICVFTLWELRWSWTSCCTRLNSHSHPTRPSWTVFFIFPTWKEESFMSRWCKKFSVDRKSTIKHAPQKCLNNIRQPQRCNL